MKNNKLVFIAAITAAIILAGGAVKAEEQGEMSRGGSGNNVGNDFIYQDQKMMKVPMMEDINPENRNFPPGPIPPIRSNQMSVNIEPNGQAKLMNAAVNSVNGNTIVASVFGINFTVDISRAKIIGGFALPPLPSLAQMLANTGAGTSTATTTEGGTGNTPPAEQITISVGDKLMVMGIVDATSGVIKAEIVRDLTAQSQSQDTIKQRIQQLMDLINQLRAQLHF